MQRYLLTIILFITFLNNAMAAVTATVDRQKVALNESFSLTYTIDSSISIMPNFSILKKDFDILEQNQSSNISVVNGNVDKKTLFKLSLAPKRVGRLIIPEISFEQAKSNSITMQVVEPSSVALAADNKDIRLEVTVDNVTPYVQQQVIVTVKLHRAVNASQESLSELKLSHQDIFLEPLFKDYKKYQSTYAGRPSITYEMKYALFPQKTGNLTIERVTYSAVIPEQQGRSGFDSFFRQSGKSVRELSKEIKLDVRDKPQEMQNKQWLPAEKVTLKGELSDNAEQLSVGDTITYTVYIAANGQPASALPALKLPPIQNAKTYPDQAEETNHATENTYLGQRTEKIAIVPTVEGSLVLPEVKMDWWNIKTDKLETIYLPQKVLQVKPATLNVDNSELSVVTSTQAPKANTIDAKWKQIALMMALGWLLTVCAWVYMAYSNKPEVLHEGVTGGQSVASLKTAVKKACQKNQAQQAQKAIIAWASQVWTMEKIYNLDDVCSLIKDAQFTVAINQLHGYLYSSGGENQWQGQSLLEAFNQLKTTKRTAVSEKHPLFNIS